MAGEHLDPGIYTNVFQVHLPETSVEVMTTSASKSANLQDLREQIQASSQNIRVYGHVYRQVKVIFGYGPDSGWLAGKGFKRQKIRLYDYPKWCTRMIVEGLADHLTAQRYREWPGKGRTKLYEPEPHGKAAQGSLRLFRGYDLRAIYRPTNQQLQFGLIVDICWEIQDASGKRLSPQEIAQHNATGEIAQLQEEFLPGNRINPEVSRLRLRNHILPFVQQNNKFSLPCDSNVEVTLNSVPLRVIVGV